MQLTLQENKRLRDYLRYVEINANTLSNEILQLVLNRNTIGISENIEKYCFDFLDNKEYITLVEVVEFIESLDLEDLSILKIKEKV